MIKKAAYIPLVLFLVSFLYGCMSMQSKSVVTLNPDMSGKCTYEIKMGKDLAGILTSSNEDLYSSFGMPKGNSKKSTEDPAMALASKILSSGTIDAWKDVQFGYLKKDTVYFKGTAYFKDIIKVAVSMFDSSLVVHRDAEGNTVMEISEMKKRTDSTGVSGLASDSVGKNMFKDMGMSNIMHYYFASLVKGLDISTTYHLPGKIVMISNFKKITENTINLSLTGQDVITLLDTLTARDDYASQMYSKYYSAMGLKGYNSPGSVANDNSYYYNKVLYGEDKPIMVVFKSDGNPSFDYNKEMMEAKEYYTKFRKSSGIEHFDSVKAAEKKMAEEEKQHEAGTLVLTAADSVNGKTYFKSLIASQYAGDISFTGTLGHNSSMSSFAKIKITKATSDKGSNVIDSLFKQSSYYSDEDSGGFKHSVSAYLSSSNYLNTGSLFDSAAKYDKVTFNLIVNLPPDTRYIDLSGVLEIEGAEDVPFKMINLYVKPADDYGANKWK